MALFLLIFILLVVSVFLMGFKALLLGKRFTKQSASLQHHHDADDCETDHCGSCSSSGSCSSFKV